MPARRSSASRSILLRASLALGALALMNRAFTIYNERRHPARGRFIEVDGVRLHYIQRGSGTPIVLIHGNGSMAEDWEASTVFARLATDHRVIAFDRPGFGYTARPFDRVWTAGRQAGLLAEAMRRLGVGPAIVVGHSWGGIVALELALQQPQQVSRLVLLSGIFYPEARADVALMSGTAIPLLGDITAHTVSPPLAWLLRNKMFRHLFAPAPVPFRFRDRFPFGLSLRPAQIRAMAKDTALLMPATFVLGSRVPTLDMPVAIMAGTGDRVVDFGRHSARLHADIRGSTLHPVDGGGHMIHYSAPGEVARVIAGAD